MMAWSICHISNDRNLVAMHCHYCTRIAFYQSRYDYTRQRRAGLLGRSYVVICAHNAKGSQAVVCRCWAAFTAFIDERCRFFCHNLQVSTVLVSHRVKTPFALPYAETLCAPGGEGRRKASMTRAVRRCGQNLRAHQRCSPTNTHAREMCSATRRCAGAYNYRALSTTTSRKATRART
jgi:hypothetical protein